MMQIVPQLKIWLCCEPVDFRKGIDSLVALCRSPLEEDPFSGALFVFRHRAGTALKLLVYDGLGFWLCRRRFSEGRIRWWPDRSNEKLRTLAAQQLSVLLYNGNPLQANFAPEWRQLTTPPPPTAQATSLVGSARP
jgi:transposase